MGGAILQLSIKGVQDKNFTTNPEITFFQKIFRRHTNFARENIERQFNGSFSYNQIGTCDIVRDGDLINQMYLKIQLPKLQAPDGTQCYWANSIGHILIEYIALEINGEIIDKQYGEWLELNSELSLSSSKQLGYNELVGKIADGFGTLNNSAFEGPKTIYVPCNFWFSKDLGSSLPMIALENSSVKVHVKFNKFSKCVIKPTSSVVLPEGNYPFQVSLLLDTIHVEAAERNKFVGKPLKYLITQTQLNDEKSFRTGQTQENVSLSFNHPIKEFIWVIQRTDVENDNNDYFNYSNNLNIPDMEDTFTQAKLMFVGQDRTRLMSSDYFRLIQPYQHHTNIPKKQIYVYSFAHKPEEYQPSGSVNFSNIDNASLQIHRSNCLCSAYIRIYAVNMNILYLNNGSCSLLYHN